MYVEQTFDQLAIDKIGGALCEYHFHMLILTDVQRRGRDVSPGR